MVDRTDGLFNGLIWPKVGCASIASAATAAGQLSSPAGCAVIPRETRKSPPPSSAVRPASGCAVDRLRPVDRHRGRDGRGLETVKENSHGDHRHLQEDPVTNSPGDIVTLSLQAKNVRIVPENRSNENGPSHRVFVGRVEIGAAWSKRSNEGRDYLWPQARRSELHRADLRQPLRRRGRRGLQPDLVPRPRPTATGTTKTLPRPAMPGGAIFLPRYL